MRNFLIHASWRPVILVNFRMELIALSSLLFEICIDFKCSASVTSHYPHHEILDLAVTVKVVFIVSTHAPNMSAGVKLHFNLERHQP